MTLRIERLGDLTCRITGDGDGPVVVLLHGFGAPGDDLVSLGEVLPAPPGTRFVFPEAPLELNGLYGDARAWWMIDFDSLERGDDRAAELPEGLPAARAQVSRLLDELRTRLGVADDRVVLGGFSQGAMLSLDVVLHSERAFAAAVLLSGTLIADVEWAPRMPARRGLPVFQSHGDRDPLLRFAAAERLRDKLGGAGMIVDWHRFRGGHEIPTEVLRALGAFLVARLA